MTYRRRSVHAISSTTCAPTTTAAARNLARLLPVIDAHAQRQRLLTSGTLLRGSLLE